ncbi:30S ribosomal protein S1 [Candidatus Dojkabacteria bacterium]|nr:30S ribosomal protein S1 [Candidatus Dojkabacteria bacterium]
MSKTNNSELDSFLDGLENPPKSFEKGQIVTGQIVKIKPGQIIVNVGGRTEGVVSGKETKLEGRKMDIQPGDDILVYVMKEQNEQGQIELSIRKTGVAREWHTLEKAEKEGLPVKVRVIEANTGGVIVDIGGGLRGFVPTSQLKHSRIFPTAGYSNKEEATSELQGMLADLISEELEVRVIEIDRDKNRVIFSEKLVGDEANAEKRQETLSKIKAGDELEGEVTGIAPFGLFVNAGSLEGLVHLSEISWDKVSNPADFHKVGDKVKIQVIGVEEDGKRVAYSIKRLQKDPWDEIVRTYKAGQKVKGTVTKVVEYGAFVRVDDSVNGLIHISELSDKLVKNPGEIVKEGQELELEIISISKEDRHLGLSLKRLGSEKKVGKGKTVDKRKSSKTNTEKGESAPEMSGLEELLGESGEDSE